MAKSKKTDWKFYFNLSKPLLYGKIKNSDISVITEMKNGKKLIIGFSVIVKNSTKEKAIFTAHQMMNRLTNFIIGENRGYRYPIMTSFSSADGDICQDFLLKNAPVNESEVSLDFTNKHLISLLKRDSRFNQQLSYYSRGRKALEESDPLTAIKEFFQVFNEEDMPRRIRAYKPLRDVLNHPRVTNKKTKELLIQNFSYLNFDSRTQKFHLDMTSTKTMNHLHDIATNLRSEAFFYMWKMFV